MPSLPGIWITGAEAAYSSGRSRRIAFLLREDSVRIEEVELVVRGIAMREEDVEMSVGRGVAIAVAAAAGVARPSQELAGFDLLARCDDDRLRVGSPVRRVRL